MRRTGDFLVLLGRGFFGPKKKSGPRIKSEEFFGLRTEEIGCIFIVITEGEGHVKGAYPGVIGWTAGHTLAGR